MINDLANSHQKSLTYYNSNKKGKKLRVYCRHFSETVVFNSNALNLNVYEMILHLRITRDTIFKGYIATLCDEGHII